MSLILGLMVLAYFLPTVICVCNRHENGVAIFIVNLLLGWTMLGWIAALVWSATVPRQQVIVSIQVMPGHAPVIADIPALPEGPSAVDRLKGFTL